MKISIKRFFAIILDFLSFLGVWALLLCVFSYGIVNNDRTYSYNSDIIENTLLETNLYIVKDGKATPIDSNVNDSLVVFYSTNRYLDTYDKNETYEESKMDSGLFFYSAEKRYYVEKDNIDKEDLSYFYSREFKKVETSLYNDNIDYQNALNYNQRLITVGAYVTIIVSSLIVYFVMPLILKRGQTVFYKLFKLEIVSQDAKTASVGQLFIHSWANTFIILLAWKFYFISFVVAFLVFVINKNHHTIGDYASVTMCKEIVYEEKRG